MQLDLSDDEERALVALLASPGQSPRSMHRREPRRASDGRGEPPTFQKEKPMQSRLPHWLLAAFVAYILLPGAASAQVSLFTRGPGLSPEDNRLLFESIARLNAAEPARVGNSDAWNNPQTNASGINKVLRVFRSGGMACHLVQHHIVTSGTGRGYHLTGCGKSRSAVCADLSVGLGASVTH